MGPRAKSKRRFKIGWPTDDGVTAPNVDESAVIDIQFDLQGTSVPIDHGFLLFLELSRILPWIATEEMVGIHPIHGAATEHGELMLNRRAKLSIRVPKDRANDLLTLTGKEILVGTHALKIGAGKAKILSLHTPLYAHCVTTGSTDETIFAADIIKLLDNLNITTRFICGRRQSLTTSDGVVYGYSLMLHDIPIEHAILIQQKGLGSNRKLGCGIFIPHKSINALT